MVKKNKLIIVGAGEFAKIAVEYFDCDSHYEVVALSAERQFIGATTVAGLPVVPYEDVISKYPPVEYHAFVAVPATQLNRVRKRFYLELKTAGYRLANYISSRAFVWRNVSVGDNVFIFENNVVQPFVQIGNNCILWSGNHIGHRTIIRDHNFISSHAVISGYCDIGEGSFIGVNSTFNDHVKVGRSCVIGSGSLVVKDTEPELVYVGQPARALPNKTSFDVKL